MFPLITSWLGDTIRDLGSESLSYSDFVLDIPCYRQVDSYALGRQYTGYRKVH